MSRFQGLKGRSSLPLAAALSCDRDQFQVLAGIFPDFIYKIQQSVKPMTVETHISAFHSILATSHGMRPGLQERLK
ncbi:hypothetical protein [Azorhizophilus paspali]|uniref:Uncharacterized protein n=1 Tax=Azorhizophilus paspali TaxID=69963 RepID=A0ABV6SLG3_AZOPA